MENFTICPTSTEVGEPRGIPRDGSGKTTKESGPLEVAYPLESVSRMIITKLVASPGMQVILGMLSEEHPPGRPSHE